MKKIHLPEYVKIPVSLLAKEGFECFIVGGCVRDILMEKEPDDFDMTTSATPDEMLTVFKDYRVIETGLKHGTLTVVSGGKGLEITTYRTDGEYKDNRHPESVSFSRNIADDLSRRDFTVNAMAYSDERGIVDLFGGQEDLKNKIIRCVGEPDKRFNEDGLRIMRALRFASTLGFEIEPNTAESIHKNRELLCNIAVERLFTEFKKLVCGKNAAEILREYADVIAVFIPEIEPMIGFDQKTKYHCFDVYEHTLAALSNCPENDIIMRLSIFFHDIGKPHCLTVDELGGHFKGHDKIGAEITDTILRRLRSDNATREAVTRLIGEHCMQVAPTEKAVKRFLSTHSFDEARRAVALSRADKLACAPEYRITEIHNLLDALINKIEADGACFTLRDLAIDGRDLAALGLKGKDIGKALNAALDAIIDGRVNNEKQELLNFIESL